MLFSGGSTGTKGTPPKETKKERKPDRDEKYEIQEAVFLRWANSVMEENLQEMREMADVKFLSKFAHQILGVPVALSGKNEADDIDAIFHAMVPDEPEDKLFQISVNELLSGQQKPLLTMCWQLIQIHWKKFAPAPSNLRKMTEALKEWCLEATSSHPDILINDFTSSFRDGMAINILIKSFDDSLVDLHEISELRGEDRIENALSLARRHFRVAKLIQPKEFYSEHLDMKSVATYLMMLYLGMCESSNRSKAPTRRRSTAPANVGGIPPAIGGQSTVQSTQPVPSQMPTATTQSLPQTPTSPTFAAAAAARQASIVSQATVPAVMVVPQIQQHQKFRTDSTTSSVLSSASLPAGPIAAVGPRIVQANMLTPPPVPQSPKAYAPLMQQQAAQGNVPSIISPLAQQSHTQAQLMQQQQIQAMQQAQMLQHQQVQAVPPGVVQQQQMPPTLPGQPIPPQIPAQYIPLPAVQIPPQPLPPLIQQPMPQSPPHQQIAQQPQLPAVHVQIVPPHQPQIQLVQTAQQPPQMLISPEQQQLLASGAQLPPISIPPLIQPQIEPKHDFQQQQPLSPKSLAQFTLPQHSADGSAEGMRSRKSSSCSSASRSRRRKPEELMQEYGNYLQQVLNWLTEAEQELASISEVHEGEGKIDSLELAKEKFREHEQYMQSLTQSQENVGRVLHRGHQLSQRLEGHESTAIISQLQVVSGRWEKIREKAMERQTALQNQIDRIQREHLAKLMGWLDKAEWRAKEIDPLADSAEKCQRQLADLGEFKNFMEEKRPAIERLSTFVAVIEQQNKNEGEGGKGEAANLLQLETLVKQVEKRWSKLGDQLELRAKLLDGLAELLGQYDESSGELSKWLEGQSQGLQGLRPARELETDEQVQEQLDMLRGMEKALERQQEAFVRLSRICSELAGKFEKGRNLKASERVHEKLDSITKRWDEIVTRLEDHSEILIQSGKVKLATDQQQPKEEGKEAEIGGGERQRLELPKRLETIYSVDESRLSESPTHQRVGSTKKRKLLQPPTEHLIEEEPTKKELRFAQGGSGGSGGGSGEEEGQKGGKEAEGKGEEAIPMEIVSPDSSKKKEKAIEAANLEQPSSSGVGELPPPPSVSPSGAEDQQTVNKFVQMITEMDRKIRPLVEWAQSIEGQQPVARQNVRQMVLICQKKLNEVREMEPAVTKMQIQLEFMHNRSKLNPKQLHGINEIFDTFMSRWSRVVATISKVLSGLSKPEPLIKSPSKTPPQQPIVAPEKQNRILVIIDQLSKWLKASAKYLDELPPAMPISERLKKIGQIAKQLSEQQAQLSHVKRVAKFTPDESKAMSELENEMVLLVGRIDKMRRAGEQEQKEAATAMGYEPPKSPRTTTVQMKKDSLEETPVTSPREKTTLFSLPGTSSADEFSPPPQNEAESLRQKLLAEEAEETNREKFRHLSSGDEGRIGGEGGGDWSKWIQEKQGQLRLGGECVPGDLKVLSAELERCDQMITELRGKLREASSSESDAEMMVAPIEELLRAAETKRNHCVDSINKTQLAIHKAVKVEEIGDKFKRELDWLRRNLADSPLREADERLKHLKTSLQAQEGIKAEAIQLLEEVAQMATTSSIPPTGQPPYGGNAGEQMRNRIQKLQLQWKQLEEEIEDLLACCSRECHRRAESWLHTKQALLEELETALKASFESATDAEELSEHLDNLERLLDRLGSIEREAQDEGYQQELTAFDPRIVALRDQNEALTRATLERCTQLRNAISRCEQFEQRLCQMQHWCTNMHQILNQRLASDTFALEVPHEYKEEQRSGTLFKKMDKEFAEYDQLVAELEEYISQSKSEFASTERLKLQLDHANQQLSQLRAKYAEFKQPIGLFERMDRIEKQLGEIELSMDDLTGIQAENCEFCLLHVEQLQRQLEELGTECAACEAGRDTLIREGILEEAQAIKITARLATLTAKCVDELEPRAKANVQRLKRASELLEKLERENAVLDKLLGEVEHRLEGELDQTMMEGRPTQRSVKALDELSRQLRAATDAAAKARELETLLRQLSIRLSQETLNGITKSEQRCSKLKDRLSQWSEKIQELAESSQTGESETDEERTLGKIDELSNELERRIGQLEQNVAKDELSREQLQEQMAEIRPLKERFEKRALQMLNKVDFSKRVAPALADLTSRWQTLNQILLEKQKEEQKARERAAREQVADQILAQVEEDLIGEIQQGIEEQGAGDLPHLMEPLGARIGSQEPMEFSDFGQRVQSMIDQFAKAKRHLNYAKHPLRSLDDWERRLTELGKYIADRKLNFDGLIAEGKHVAEVGPMELVTSAALAKLDELIELVHELDEQIEREETRLHKMRKQFGKFNEQIGLTRERLAAMEQKAANLNQRAIDPTPIITLQQELMDTSGQLQLLQLSAEELRKSLPPAMHQERIGGDVLDHLNRQLHEIEARVQTALLRALQAQQDEAEEEPQFGQPEEEEEEEGTEEEGYSLPMASTSSEPVAAAMPLGQFDGADDRIQATNRTAAPSFSNADNQFPAAKGPTTLLAMDAYGTDEEEAKGVGRRRAGGIAATKDQKGGEMEGGPDEFLQSSVTPHLPSTSALNQKSKTTPKSGKQKTSIEQILPPQMEELVNLDQFYVNLNTMEEYMDQRESLPFEGLDEKADILKDFETELQRGEQLVGARQMTMEVGESEHIRGRIATLRGRLAKRMGELKRRRETIAALDQFFGQCELMLDELAQNCKSPRQSPRRVKSPQNGGEKEGKVSPSGAAPVLRNRSPDLDELETAQAQLESQLPPIAVRLQQIQNRLNSIAEQLTANARDKFQQRIRLLVEDFNECTKIVRAKRKALEERFADQTHLNQQLEELEFWCDETEALVDTADHLGPLNPPKLEKHIERVRQRHCSADAKLDSFRQLERLKDRFVGLASVEPQAKHEVRRNVAQLGKRISDVRMKLKEKMDTLFEEKISADELWREFAAMQIWVENAEHQVRAVENAKIFKPSLANIEKLVGQISENRFALQNIQRKLAEQKQMEEGLIGGVEKENLMRVDDLIRAFEEVVVQIERLIEQRAVASEESSSVEEEIEQLYSQMDLTKKKLAKTTRDQQRELEEGERHYAAQMMNGHPQGEEESDGELGTRGMGMGHIEYGTLSTHSGEGGGGQSAVGEIPISPLGMDNDSVGEEFGGKYPRRRMSLGEQARLDTVTRLRSWLQEVERDIAASVDLSDQHLVRQALGRMQNCVDDIQINQLEIIRVLDEAKDRLIVERAQLCSAEMERVLAVCKRRKGDLQKILEQCRIWEQLRSAIELWLTEANDRLTSGGRVLELTDPELAEQLELCGGLANELDAWKEKLQEMNRVSNQLLDIYRRDDGHNLSHLSSKLNTQWTKFNDQLRIRRAVLEAAQRSRHDFQTAIGHFQQWLNRLILELQKLEKETENAQRLKDTGRRREWLAQEKEARMEIDAHRDMMESVKKMGRKLLEEQQQELSALGGEDLGTASSKAREQLRKRVEAIESEWQALQELNKIVRDRLESAQEECERLTQSLAEFLFWTDQQRKTIANTQPVAGDLSAVQKQCDIVRTIQRGVEARERPVEECIQLAHEFLMQHNLRPPLHHPSLMDEPPADPYSPKTEAEREERRVGQQINSDSKQLQTQWALLKEELNGWYQQVSDAYKEMQDLDRAMAEALLSIGQVEEELHALKPVEDLLLEELKAAKAESAEFRQRVHEASTHVDDVNNWASSIQATGIQLSEQLESQVHTVNERFDRLKRDLGCRWAALERAFNDFGPASEHFLVDLVEPPWQRAISNTNRLPYYIDHSTERTQWDHPAMVDILEGLCSFNQVKFSAYRTAMKLRALQKRLCLDLIDLPDLNVQYEKHLANYTDDQRIQVEDVIQCLLPLFEKAHEERPALVPNVSLAVDLTLNLLLNIFDPCRDGKMRVLSFKVALVVLCHATLESKYIYLFHLISNKDGVDHKRLAVLFYDLIHIPKFLGEAAAFGGSNIEPSVRSCFENAKFPPTINVDQFLEWLKKEPQSLVWLPVMHRLASSEFAKHQAKCNACKMFPIVGLRYRCLRCFNFDICQNCFFSQRIAKSHKLNHPMQEYCTPTSTGDDVRDFTAVIKNKMRQGKGKIGYLPVDQILEGPLLECTDQCPQNADTEAMHQRMQLIASRLDKRQTEAIEHFPSAIILPSADGLVGKFNVGSRNVQMGSLPGPIMIGNGTESENGSSSNNENEPMETRPKHHQFGANLQSPEIQIFHDRQHQLAALAAAHQDVKSPSQLVNQVDQVSKEELGQLLQKLQYENIELKRKIEERRKAIRAGIPYQNGATSTPNLYSRTPLMGYDGNRQASEAAISPQKMANIQTTAPLEHHTSRARSISSVGQTPMPTIFAPQQPAVLPPPVPRQYNLAGRSMPASLHRQHSLGSPIYQSSSQFDGTTAPGANDHEQQMAVLAETHQLRMHQKRLEERGVVLEDQNRQLQMQLERLQKLMEKKGETPIPLANLGGPLGRRDLAIAQSAGVISSTDAEDTDMEMLGIRSSDIRNGGGLSTAGQIGTEIRRNRMDRLRETVDELNRAMENFVQFTQNCAANGAAAARRDHPDTDQDSGTADQEEGQITTDEHEGQ